ncbi:Scr1 family TA system antitoxin-like transcriptional regulator [Micromonospora sp. CA-263727]|uniref:Scr1 family TA system antitoxin-like transcriptional regulator n=1 Tax=Micromonospora sp. CA-263727 TaxID=3239967 RepID=UPI003D8D6D6C
MVEPLRHLPDVAKLPNVSLRVLPLAAGPPLASETGTFVVLGFPQGVRRTLRRPLVGGPSYTPGVNRGPLLYAWCCARGTYDPSFGGAAC